MVRSFLDERRGLLALIFTLTFFLSIFPGLTSAMNDRLEGLLSMDLEDLMNVEVISPFKKPQSIKNIPAAVYVITADDIRRAGVSSIPEALRMAPGVNVAKIDNGDWAVSIRGFNGLFSDKLLVLMDGRTLYDPLFSGVFWDVQDTVLEDIDRIEIIRGPGASSWGTNAVNGVINIITKNANDTVGGLLSGSAGNMDRGTLSARYGFKMGDLGAARFFVKAFKRHQQLREDGSTAWDDRFMERAGFRADFRLGPSDSGSLKAEIYTGEGTSKTRGIDKIHLRNVILKNHVPVSGGFILTDLTHDFGDGIELDLRFYYDHTERKISRLTILNRDTLNFEFKNRNCLGSLVDFVWGGTYRHIIDEIPFVPGAQGGFIPQKRKDDLFSLFFQNEIKFFDDRLRFLTGVRFDHYNYSGWDVQPTFRALYSIGQSQDVWLAVSRAARSPSRYNRDTIWGLDIVPMSRIGRSAIMTYMGSDDVESEELWAFEVGYRWRVARSLTLELAGFANFYDNLSTVTAYDLFPHHGFVIFPIRPENHGEGENLGLEFTCNVKPYDWWRMELSYSYLDSKLWVDSGYRHNTQLSATLFASPRHQLSVRSNMDITPRLDFDVWLRYVSELSEWDIPSYCGLDVRIGYRPVKNLELSVNARNLLDPYHPEFFDKFLDVERTEVPRTVSGKITWRF